MEQWSGQGRGWCRYRGLKVVRGQAEHAGMAVSLVGIGLEMIDTMKQGSRLGEQQKQRENGESQPLHGLSVSPAAAAEQGAGFSADPAIADRVTVLIAILRATLGATPPPRRALVRGSRSAKRAVSTDVSTGGGTAVSMVTNLSTCLLQVQLCCK
jgi:hypothetical protein